jgi:hypothetical protein
MMIELRPLGANQTELTIDDVTMFFSYSTLVVALISGKGWYKVSDHYSSTTSKHIKQFIPASATPTTISASGLQALIAATLKGA